MSKPEFRITDRVRRPPLGLIDKLGRRHGTVEAYDRWGRPVVRWDDGVVDPIDLENDPIEHVPPEDEA